MQTGKIRVLVVDDSLVFRNILTKHLSGKFNIEIVGTSANAFDAQIAISELKPDVVTLDIEMPGMSGIELLSKILRSNLVPVVLVSSLNISVFDALSAGAVDFVHKPDMSAQNSMDIFLREVYHKIVIASYSKVRPVKETKPILKKNTALINSPNLDSVIIAIGASTGEVIYSQQ